MKYKVLLIVILLVAAFLRLYNLSAYPAGLNADEAALGYNAYSLLLTGKDEHGHPWPVNLESFGDYKPALYAYLVMPFIKVMGLTELAVRLPSALAGIVGVGLIYLLVYELTKNKSWGLLSAFGLAISPWSLHFSRGGWETNVANTLLLLGMWLMVKWARSLRYSHLLLSVVALVLAMYTYQSTRLLAPLLGLSGLIVYWKLFWGNKRHLVLAVLVSIILLLPLGISLVTTGAASRADGVGLLADEGPVNRANELRGHYTNLNSLPVKILHNRWVLYGLEFFQNYSSHFQGNFLFINGDAIERNKVPETGLLYLTDILLIVVGIVAVVRSSSNIRLIWLWLAIAPLAAGLTFQTPHALRASSMVIPLIILASAGVLEITKRWKVIGISVLSLLYVWQVGRYLHEYYIHYLQTYPMAWEYGFKQLVPYIENMKGNYSKVLVTDKYDQPYILFLFYSRYSPEQFQKNHTLTVRDRYNFSTVRDYDQYHFAATPWDKVSDQHPTLIVAAPEDIPEVGVNVVKTLYFPSGEPAFKIISN